MKNIITCFTSWEKLKKAIMGICVFLVIAAIALGLAKSKKDDKNEILLRVPRSSGDTINQKARKLLLKFDFNRASTSASNQYAIWIEDSKGNLVKTLYATDFTVHGGYRNRTDSLKFWVRKSNLASMSDSKIDAVSGATPRAGQQTYIWDCKDDQGNIVPNGQYHFYLEGTLYWTSDVLFSGSFTVGGESMNTIQIAEKYTENTETNRNMISSVTATYAVD